MSLSYVYIYYIHGPYVKSKCSVWIVNIWESIGYVVFFPFPSLDQSSPVLAMDNCNENEPEIY